MNIDKKTPSPSESGAYGFGLLFTVWVVEGPQTVPFTGGEGAGHGGVTRGAPESPESLLKSVYVSALHTKLPGVPEHGPRAVLPAVYITALLEQVAIFIPDCPIAMGDSLPEGRDGLHLAIVEPRPPGPVFNRLTLLGLNKSPSLFDLSRRVVQLVRGAAGGASGDPSTGNQGETKREDQLVCKRVIHGS